MNTQKIVEYLKTNYNAIGAILHGSRANGTSLENSDWDIFLFVENGKDLPKFKLVNLGGQSLDIGILDINRDREALLEEIVLYSPYANVMFSTSDFVPQLLEEAQKRNEKGINLDEDLVQKERDGFMKEYNRCMDYLKIEDDILYKIRIADIWRKAYRLWWVIKKRKYSVSPKIGLEKMKQEDGGYYDMLMQVLSCEKQDVKVGLEKIKKNLFN